MNEISNILIMLHDHSWLHLNATEGQRSAGPNPVFWFKEDEIQMDGVDKQGFKTTKF